MLCYAINGDMSAQQHTSLALSLHFDFDTHVLGMEKVTVFPTAVTSDEDEVNDHVPPIALKEASGKSGCAHARLQVIKRW